MTTHRRPAATDPAAQASGPQVRAIPPGSNAYLLHEMREVEIGRSAIQDLLVRRGASLGTPTPSFDEVCRALRDVDARLFVPQ